MICIYVWVFLDDAFIRQSNITFKYYFRPSFNTLCLKLFHVENILLGFVKVLWRINEVHSLEEVDPYQKVCILLLLTYYDERSDFPTKVQDTLAYQHGLCLKKGRKCSNGLKTLDEEQSDEFNHCETIDTWKWKLYIWNRNKTWIIYANIFFRVKLFINFCIDTKLSKHFVCLDKKD